MSYHIIIAEERRTPVVTEMGEDRSRLAVPITSTLQQGEEWVAGETMLHSMGVFPGDVSDPQFVMVAEWDGTSHYVIQHKGDYATRNLSFSGWPEITKEQFEALQGDVQ